MYAHFGKPFVQVADGNGTAFDPNASGSPDMVGRNHQESYGLSLGYHVFTTFFSGALAVHTQIYTYIHIHPAGGKPRQRFERFEKKCRFRHSETAGSFPKMVLKIPGILKWFFNDDL